MPELLKLPVPVSAFAPTLRVLPLLIVMLLAVKAVLVDTVWVVPATVRVPAVIVPEVWVRVVPEPLRLRLLAKLPPPDWL